MVIDYKKFVDDAMLEVIRKVLLQIQHSGFGDHQLYISFKTSDPLVQLSSRIKKSYPNEITIVLEHQFDNLVVEPYEFKVGISFDGIYEQVKVPFRAITRFSDYSANFTIQLDCSNDLKGGRQTNDLDIVYNVDQTTQTDNVIELDKFRNKNKPSD